MAKLTSPTTYGPERPNGTEELTPIAQELEERLWYLADPSVQWVKGSPIFYGQSCLVYDGGQKPHAILLATRAISLATQLWLDDFVRAYARTKYNSIIDATNFNDGFAGSRDEVLWMLEEAVDQAKWEGV